MYIYSAYRAIYQLYKYLQYFGLQFKKRNTHIWYGLIQIQNEPWKRLYLIIWYL